MPGSHSLISPSSAERVLQCPPSVARGLLFPFERTNDAADEGTKAHAVLEAIGTDAPLPDFATEEMIEHANRFLELLVDSGYDQFEQEVRVNPAVHPALAGIHPDPIMSGTADILLPNGVADYKYGRKRVHPDSLQLLLYAASRYPQPIYVTGIFQPRLNPNEIMWAHTTEEMLTERLTVFGDSVRQAVRLIVLQQMGVAIPLADYKEGGHCYFCPSIAACPKKLEGLTTALDQRNVLPMERLLDMLEDFEVYAKSVKETAFNAVLAGHLAIPGWGVAPGRTPAGKWSDQSKVIQWVEDQRIIGSIPDDKLDSLVTTEPATPAQVKKILKEIPGDLEEMIYREEPKLSLQRIK